MNITLSTQHIKKIENSLKQELEKSIKDIVEKYLRKADSAHINLSQEGKDSSIRFFCEILVHTGVSGHDLIVSKHTSHSLYDAFQGSLLGIEKQVSKLHDKSYKH